MHAHRLAGAAFSLVALCVAADPTRAQDYPVRPITMVVPFAAGGPTDIIARATALGMSKALGQQIVIENVAGAAGSTGVGRLVRLA